MSIEDLETVIQAVKNGKTIQMLRNGKWVDIDFVGDLKRIDHRVKQEPRDLWLQECGGVEGTAKGLWQEKFEGLGTHFREVIP
jgi:hypothetical protein